MQVAFLAFEEFEELDLVGPREVFTMAGAIKPTTFSNFVVSHDGAPLRAAKGLEIRPHFSFGQAPQADILVIPGGWGVDPLLDNAPTIAWLRETAQNCSWVTSVCAGALLLQVASLVDGRRITTPWGRIQQAREIGRVREVVEGVRYVRDGQVVTSAGISAGIDMALWLVGVIGGAAFARDVQHQIEYYPAPPYTAET